MKPNYHLKHISVFISAIAMLFGAAPLAQAETLSSYVSSKRSEQSAIAADITSKQVNNQIKQSVSTRAADLLPADDPTIILSEPIPTNQGSSTATQYSFQPMSPSASATQSAVAPAPTNEAVFTETYGEVTPDNSDRYADNYLSQNDTLDDDGLFDDNEGVLDEDNDVFEDETFEEGEDNEVLNEEEGVLDNDTDGLNNDPLEDDSDVFEDEDSTDDVFEDNDTFENDTDGVFEDDDTFDDDEVYEENDEGVFDDEEGIFEDEDTDDGDGDDIFEDAVESISPGRATRSGQSYIGIGGNIGLGDGDTALGEGSFAAFSKIGLTRNISVRPSVLINDNPTILLPVTFDFVPGVTELTENVSEEIGFRVSPFIGAGAAISTGDDGSVDFLATGGVDVPLGDNFTGVAAVNVSLFDDPAVGLLLGVGINFPALR